MTTSMKSSQTITTKSNGSQPLRKRRQAAGADKKMPEDEFMAAAIGDVEWLKQSLKDSKDKSVNFDKHGLAAIHLAAIHGRLECLRWLVTKHKSDVNQPSETGWRPIHLCISNQTGKRAFQCLSFLLEKGADPSIENDDQVTPVHQASTEGHVQCLKVLLEAGAKIDGKDKHGNSPVDLAKLWGHRKCARLLASELWHRDKSFWSKEMRQLEKVKMVQLMHEFALEDELEAEKKVYGEQAHEDWKESKGMASQKKPVKSKPPHDPKRPVESLQKPNSLVANRKTVADSIMSITEEPEPSRTTTSSATTQRRSQLTKRSDTVSELDKSADARSSPKSASGPLKFTSRVRHPQRWQYSKRPSDLEYVPILGDIYPRDPYSVLPDKDASPQSLRLDYDKLRSVSEEMSRAGSAKGMRMPKLPKDVIKKRLYGDPKLQDRPVVYKCKNIMDVEEKRKYEHDLKPRDEIMFHLSNDISTPLFKEGVTTPRAFGNSDLTSHPGSAQRLANQLSRFAPPQPFPAFKGDYFNINRDHVETY